MQNKIHPVILSGGTGARLWPMSRPDYPKQLLPLSGAQTMLQETARRVSDPDRFAAPLIVCNEAHRFIIAEQLHAIGRKPGAILLEPIGRNTAPAAAVAALLLAAEDRDAMMLLLPSDHVVTDTAGFVAAVDVAAKAAARKQMVLFGMQPERPETGFGYIIRGSGLDGVDGAYAIERFVEKPNAATAETIIGGGHAFWNSGMFLFSASVFLEELARFEPAVFSAARAAVDRVSRDLDFCRLERELFERAPSVSIDNAVMERTERAAVVPAAFGWSDVGSWSALWDLGPQDGEGNLLVGDVLAVDTRNSYVRSHDRLVATVGVENVVVVETGDAVLVMAKDRSQDVRLVVDQLNAGGRSEAVARPRVYRPWGFYESVVAGNRFQVKHIQVKPGARLSLQMHHHRSEHWVVVNGTARVVRDSDSSLVRENESIYIPCGAQHRLENPGKVPLDLIEVQTGSYLGEDDIVRIEDIYGRA